MLYCSVGLGEVLPCLPWPMDIMGRLFRPPDGCCTFIELQPVAPRAEEAPALRWGTYLHLSTIWAASGAASSPWACLRLPASLFLSLRPAAAAGADAAAVPHTNWYRMSTEVGGSFWLMPHVGCEWRGEFEHRMAEAVC